MEKPIGNDQNILSRTGFTGLICLCVVMALIRPGIFDLVTPTHSDLYRYFDISQERWVISEWLMPRPLMLAYLKIFGVAQSPKILFAALAVPAIAFISLIPYSFQKISGKKLGIAALISFACVAVGSPWFFPLFQYDYGGMLAGALAVGAVLAGAAIVRGELATVSAWALVALLVWVSMETKPNYGAALLALSGLTMLLERNKRSTALFLLTLCVVAGVMIKDVRLGSAFIRPASSNSDYAVVVAPIKNLRVLLFYAQQSCTKPLLVALAISIFTIFFSKGWKTVLYLLTAAISASAPMALLVNREWDIYAWYTTAILALIVAIAVNELWISVQNNGRIRYRIAATFGLFVIGITLMLHMTEPSVATEWTASTHKYNKNMLKTLSSITTNTGKRALFVGVQGAYHPFRNTKFIEENFAQIGPFDVVLKEAERSWNERSYEETNGVYPRDVAADSYSSIVVIDINGNLLTSLTPTEFKSLSPLDQRVLLNCGEFGPLGEKPDSLKIIKILECLNDASDFPDTVTLGNRYYDLAKTQPWIYYHLGQAYAGQKDQSRANEAFRNALAADPTNERFRSALRPLTPN